LDVRRIVTDAIESITAVLARAGADVAAPAALGASATAACPSG